jgi:hypothetical protein
VTPSTPRSTSKSDTSKDAEVALPAYEEAVDQGFIGYRVDTRDDDEYTVAGVIKRAKQGPPDIRVEVDPEHRKRDE